jgi:hypothetical protein
MNTSSGFYNILLPQTKYGIMKKTVLTYSLLSGAIITAIMGISAYWYSSHPDFEFKFGEIIGYGSMILTFSMIFVAIKAFRDKFNNGEVSFGKAFLIGLYISLIASTVYVAVWALEYHYLYPDFMEKYAAHAVAELKASGMPQDKMDAKLKEMAGYRDMYKNPIFFTLMTYAEILPVGIVVSLICALILKKKK